MMAETRYQDDLYDAVNGEWEKTAVIDPDKTSTGGFNDLADGVEAHLMADFAAVSAGEKTAPDQYFAAAVKLYDQAKDFKARDAAGIQPALDRLAPLNATSDLAAFNAKAADLEASLFPMPFDLGVEPDMKDTSVNKIMLTGPSTILPDTTYYTPGNEQAAQLLKVWSDMVSKLLAQTDLSAPDQKSYLADALAFDAELAKHVKSREEWADYPKMYNPQSFAEVAAQFGDFDFSAFAEEAYGEKPETIIVGDPRFLKEFTQLFGAATFDRYKHWAYVNDLLSNTGYLSEDLRQLGGTFGRALSGNPEAPKQIKHAYRLANSFFSEPIGLYYGRTYFGEAAKADVTKLVENMIETYKSRLRDSSWLSEETKTKAIVKLDKMVLKMGYPDKVNEVYDRFNVDEKADLLTNVTGIAEARHAYNVEQLQKPVDRTTWLMPGHLVNACYDPSRNDITFPAAILQAPFYALDQSASENYGGIGAVIAHEISHGFDNNGAQFDEFGNMVNWWQEADYAHFKTLTQQMIDEFDGIETSAGKVNGKLIVSENIADAGGLAAALQTAKAQPDVDLKAFFTNWARIWRQKARPEYMKFLLSIDVHAPAKLRANIQPRNLDDWYTAFDVQPGDGMYIAPEKRVHIW
ncbi:MAG: M13 family peptidase [Lactobacillus sp.]|uniref:M13 family metallopeptidase n=1 Tax=Lacticaseibacillus suilingensis TaxID=2799577 RepID=UPI0022E1C805|nr:M13-type metalloendopeptidase [Lacticaseibacillus suilingensis]MCI1894678.1 M13 family peptidase [Lactobacillus sp.]MCI1940455.1 M13 family peptidase [Lactobacillus sp.]MCI1971140.1 M13 family peptidase [Lactobacillus sp.]MCI2017884.1 M13 family peptidase [Lactobacillus sp.]MCI2037320.1 M13 family peptidase [Lactobacillus sp.]